ncbi:RHS repeat-associated core domain-containing protein [Halomonas sp. C05BenzN]|uniref:RHS repeat-associated core domain-containing protein n=1 Tax=Halomonas sp. C05BenzN TaxID=3411041 RepID=UPI003B95BEB0
MSRFPRRATLAMLLLAPVPAMANWYITGVSTEVRDLRFATPELAQDYVVDYRSIAESLTGTYLNDWIEETPYTDGRLESRVCFLYLDNSGGDYDPATCTGEPSTVYERVAELRPDTGAMADSPFLNRDLGRPDDGLCVGNPIHAGTGNKFEAAVDVATAGAEPLVFERVYNSQDTDGGQDLGLWRHSFERSLEVDPERYGDYMVVLVRQDGQRLAFYQAGDAWLPTWHSGDRLIQGESDGGAPRWHYHRADGHTETYDAAGRLLRIERSSGNVLSLSYQDDQLQAVDDAYGRALTFQWASNQLVGVIDPAGELTQYGYTGEALTQVTFPDSTFQQYVYDDPHDPALLTGWIDERGIRVATWAYDDQGRAVLSEHADGVNRTTLDYSAPGQTVVTNALGHEQTLTYARHNGRLKPEAIEGAPCTGFDGGIRSFEYDSRGLVSRITDEEGQRRDFQHNDRGLETRAPNAHGGTVTTSWHPEVALPIAITEPQRVTTLSYDDRYRLTSSRVAERYGDGERTWTYTYHPDEDGVPGQLASIDGPRSDVTDLTTFDYDGQGNLTTITNALGHVTQLAGHDAHGRPQSLTDANGVSWTLAYDDRQRLISLTGPTGTTTFTFDPAGLLIGETLPNGATLTHHYDDAQRRVATTDASGNRLEHDLNALGDPELSRLRDAQDTVHWQETRQYGENGWLLAITNALGHTTQRDHDRVANLIRQEDPAGDAYGVDYDGFHQPTRVTNPLGRRADLRYDDAGNLIQVSDYRLRSTSYYHNGFGDVTRLVSPDSGETRFTYDEAGNLATRTDALGQVTTYSHDALNRLTRIATDDPAEPDVILGYDDPGAEYGIGRLTSATDGAGVTTFDYHPSGEVKRETRSVDGDTHTLSYTYDGAGQIETITYPSGRVVTYQRDSAGRVEQVTTEKDGTSTVLANQIDRAPFGPITSQTRGNGLTETRTLDQAYQVDVITVPGILERDYGHTVDANVASIDDLLQSARNQAFGYDAADRLTAATGGYGALGFEYDHNANRTARLSDGQRHSYQVNRSNNWLLEAETQSYQLDAAGNLVQRGQDSFVYDSHHRLTEATVDGTTASYAYNVYHQRTSKTVNGTTTRFFYGPDGELLAEIDGDSGATLAEYVWLDGTPLAYLADGEIYHIHVDHLGTPQVLTDATGAIAWEAHYRPFGDAITSGSLTFNLRFPGQYHDAETGLHYNWHRYYDPQTGRYLTSDPIGLMGGLNPYLYAEANPLYFTDPEGLMAPQLIGGGLGFAVSAGMTIYQGGDLSDAFLNGVQAGAAGFISGGGSVAMGVSASVLASFYRSNIECGESGVSAYIDATASGGLAMLGGLGGAKFAKIIIRPKWKTVEPSLPRRAVERIFRIPPKEIDVNKRSRAVLGTVVGVSAENIAASYYTGCSCG